MNSPYEVLTEICKQFKIKQPSIRTVYQGNANAWTEGFKNSIITVTNNLVVNTSKSTLKAIIGHELYHARKHHSFKRLCLLIALIITALIIGIIKIAFPLMVVTVLTLVFLYHIIVLLQEVKADAFAAEVAGHKIHMLRFLLGRKGIQNSIRRWFLNGR